MNVTAFFFAIIGAAITFSGFLFSQKFESKICSALIKICALAAGFYSMPALESLMHVEGAAAAGGYWAYIMIGAWILSGIFGRSKNNGE